MDTKSKHSLKKSFDRRQGKYTSIIAQEKIIFQYLRENVATTSMISEATGIPRPNICRLKRNIEQSGLLSEVRKGICTVTGHKAFFLTTNPDLFPNKQLKLFRDE